MRISLPPKVGRILVILGAILLLAWLVCPPEALTRVWYRGRQVPVGWLHLTHRDGRCMRASDGHVYCFDTDEELSAATGVLLPGVDPEAVQALRAAGAVPDLSSMLAP